MAAGHLQSKKQEPRVGGRGEWTRVCVGGASFTRVSGKPRGREGRKDTNKYISKVRLKSSWRVKVPLSREKSEKLIKSQEFAFFLFLFKCNVYVNIIKVNN